MGIFAIEHRDTCSQARAGMLMTAHGQVPTPAFMPVGSVGTVKGIDPEELQACGFRMLLCNAYHLLLRPGHHLIAERGGLHRFIGWSGAILTDSGGFQLVSLAGLSRVTDEGVWFKSHVDGALYHLTPERCIEVQRALGSDIMMVLDDCPPYPSPLERVREAVRRTTSWAQRCRLTSRASHQALFGIVQGGTNHELRRQSARELVAQEFDGYAVGGLSLGEDKSVMWAILESTLTELPDTHPRYLMGVGRPEDLVEGVWRGIDLFDCVMPTRHGRTGWLFTTTGRVLIKQAQYARDDAPIDPLCRCPVCRKYSRAYLRHLFLAREMLGVRLNTLHNLWYYGMLMEEIRAAITANRFAEFRAQFYAQRGGMMREETSITTGNGSPQPAGTMEREERT
ncbi:MAG: tRNA guanosine(34) transglycosylase Tgt [Nitrospirae bacterium]|nr:MAG: tRNA guanosine(34) transglycosylase Tgt [Nitrospirota bacterium]